jgi:hypothetical protein
MTLAGALDAVNLILASVWRHGMSRAAKFAHSGVVGRVRFIPRRYVQPPVSPDMTDHKKENPGEIRAGVPY